MTRGIRILLCAQVLAFAALPACATQREDLARGQRAFEQSAHERALAIFRAMEPELGRLSPAERAQYAYLRGMTDYRIGYRVDARHWLALAKAMEDVTPGSLPADWKARIAETTTELNSQVYDNGLESLTNSLKGPTDAETAARAAKHPARKKPASDDDP